MYYIIQQSKSTFVTPQSKLANVHVSQQNKSIHLTQ